MHGSPGTPLQIEVRRVEGVEVPWPAYQTPGAAGMDLHAALTEPMILRPGERKVVRTGLAFAIPAGFEGQVRPRSGLALRHGVTVLNAPGTVDSDYRGEVAVVLINLGTEPVTIQPLDRIAQIVFARYAAVVLEPKERLGETARGAGGYGSTGM